MKNYACPKCGSIDIFLKESGNQKGLYCSEGCGWIKWVSKKELPMVEEFIKNNKIQQSQEPTLKEDNPIYGVMTLKDYYKQKKFELELDNNAYNRGVVKGLESALKILGAE